MSWTLENIEECHKESPYTFYLPSNEVLSKLKVGDQVKLIFISDEVLDNGCRAERMWVEITEINGDFFRGMLRNSPHFMESPKHGDVIEFHSKHICSTLYEDPASRSMDVYFDSKVIVSNDVLERRQFNFMLRDDPNSEQDTGWTFFSGYEDDDFNSDSANFQVVSLGVLLNMDDSILEFLDASPPCAYERDGSGRFVVVDDYDWEHYYGG